MIQGTDDGEGGFTLIELMVVVLIIAILIAIAVPTYRGAQARAQDRAAQSTIRITLTAAKTMATDQAGQFKSDAVNAINAAALSAQEPAVTFSDTPANASGTVFVTTPGATDGSSISLMAKSVSGTWYQVTATSTGTIGYCSPAGASLVAAGACTAQRW